MSTREVEVLRLAAKGLTTQEIADRLEATAATRLRRCHSLPPG